jgi:two-component system, chemotaxis family, CheB/CheR fusion protein
LRAAGLRATDPGSPARAIDGSGLEAKFAPRLATLQLTGITVWDHKWPAGNRGRGIPKVVKKVSHTREGSRRSSPSGKRVPGKKAASAPPAVPQQTALIVGIGASAGGLEAFTRFFAAMPANSGMAFVLVQHLDPQRISMLVELLSAKTSMPVVAATDGTAVAADSVFVIPPNAVLTIIDGVLRVSQPAPAREHRRPIDAFFTSLAEDQGERAACVILSGFGSDGTEGVRAVKEHGGLTLAQAEFDQHAKSGMPSSAAATGLVDFVLPVEAMPERLMSYWSHLSGIEHRKGPDGARHDMAEAVAKICGLLRRALGHDFSEYKQNTVIRRIQRRMQVLQIDNPIDYFEHLRRTPSEIEALFRELLINVTGFFRDPDAFAAIHPAIADIVANKENGDQIRVWVPACATGEEAYSIAILLAETVSDNSAGTPKLQIFATDIDEHAIITARAARYRESLLADVSEERRRRWFVREGDHYCPVKSIRESCIFSTHSVVKDPPFSKLDLIACRNLLIYLNTALQERILRTFHYALRSNGVLFLGTSESIGRQTNLYASVDKKHRIYRRRDTSSALPDFPLVVARGAADVTTTAKSPATENNVEKNARRVMEKHLPAYVVVDRNHDVIRFSGETERYLGPSPGMASLNLFSLIRKALRTPTRSALQKALLTQEAVKHENLVVQANGHSQLLDLIVEPLNDGNFVVAFAEQPAAATDRNASAPPELSSDTLERELAATRERLQATIDELETANEEMKSSNEEYQSVNEELQSINEELETSKEEMQSINEELQTVNAELNSKNEQLTRSVSDLTNLKNSTQIATIIVDNALHIRDFTPPTTAIFHLREGDRGRPVTELVNRLADANLEDDAGKVIRDLANIEREVMLKDIDTTFLMRMVPYWTIDNVIDGVVMTFVDITDRKRYETERGTLSAIVDSSLDAIIGHGLDGTITTWNRAAETIFGYRANEVVGTSMSVLFGPGREDEAAALFRRVGQAEVMATLDTELMRKDRTKIAVALTVSPVRGKAGAIVAASTIATDATDRKKMEDHQTLLMHELSHRVKNTLATVQSITAQTLRASGVGQEARAALEGRLIGLARAHDVLMEQNWVSADLREIVSRTLNAFAGNGSDRLRLEGPPVHISPKAALALAMALQELATNASKYGALSNDTGHVKVSWAVRALPTPGLSLRWQESGGPPVASPDREGFGSRLIKRNLSMELGGAVDVVYRPDGVVCTVDFPLAGG